MHILISAMLIVVAVIHLLPLVGVLGGERLTQLYGVAFDEPNVAILMRHRSVLFGMLGSFFAFAAFAPVYQPLAFIAGFVSVISFLWIAVCASGYSANVRRVVVADVAALICLVIGAAAYAFEHGESTLQLNQRDLSRSPRPCDNARTPHRNSSAPGR